MEFSHREADVRDAPHRSARKVGHRAGQSCLRICTSTASSLCRKTRWALAAAGSEARAMIMLDTKLRTPYGGEGTREGRERE